MGIVELLILLAAYLLGSVPSAVWVGKGFHGIDVREHGSGNAGATNTFRVLGKPTGIAVLLLDIIKGLTAANLAYFSTWILEMDYVTIAKIILGMIAVVGHIYPIFAGFKGGKGIATLLGMVLALSWSVALSCIAVFLIVFLSTGIVSIASIISTLSFGLFVFLYYGQTKAELLFFGIFAAVLVLYTHRSNLKRLWDGEEKKVLFRSKT